MANAAWPSSLPPPLQSGATRAPAFDNVIRTTPESGPSKTRRRCTYVPRIIKYQFSLTGAEVNLLEGFVRDVLKDVLPFDYLDPTDWSTRTYKFRSFPTSSYDEGAFDSWTTSIELEEAL